MTGKASRGASRKKFRRGDYGRRPKILSTRSAASRSHNDRSMVVWQRPYCSISRASRRVTSAAKSSSSYRASSTTKSAIEFHSCSKGCAFPLPAIRRLAVAEISGPATAEDVAGAGRAIATTNGLDVGAAAPARLGAGVIRERNETGGNQKQERECVASHRCALPAVERLRVGARFRSGAPWRSRGQRSVIATSKEISASIRRLVLEATR